MDLAAVHDWILGLSSQPLRLSQAKTLAWLVVSLVQTQKLTLASLAQNARAKTSFKHKLKRVFRFFANHRVEPEIAFKPFARKLLKRRKKRLIVAMDWTETNGLHTHARSGRQEKLSIVVFREISSGVLHDSVNELFSFQEKDDFLVAVQASPTLLGTLSQLEHHRQAGLPRTASFGLSMTQPDCGKRRFDRVGRP